MAKKQVAIPPGTTMMEIDYPTTVVSSVPEPTILFNNPEEPPNQSPTVNAGEDATLTLPISSLVLNGAANDIDGIISIKKWSKVSGPNDPTFSTPNALSTQVTGLIEGEYVFRLAVIDDDGSTAFDDRKVTIKAAVVIPPASGYKLVKTVDFTKDFDLNFGGHNQQAKGILSNVYYTTPSYSFESIPDNVSSGTRSELQFEGSDTPTEGRVEWDMRHEVIVPDSGHCLQFHPNTNGGSASPGLWHVGGKFVWNNWNRSTKQNTAHSTGVTIPTNTWQAHAIEYRVGSNGYFRHYIDGKLVCSWTGEVGDGSGQYLKVGYNGWSSAARNSRIYYDNIRIYEKIN